MAVSAKVQAYIPFPVADWIRSRAEESKVSVSVIVRDLLVEAWCDEYQSRKGPAALDPVRQNLFITVALDAILSSLGDGRGTPCSLPTFILEAGMVHSLASRSISLHLAPRTSPDLAAVRIRNSRANRGTLNRVCRCAMNAGTAS
jgi:hypothetical protein